jgi:ankyrin repeat protein
MLPLQVAVNAGNADMVKLLLRRGAKIDQLEALSVARPLYKSLQRTAMWSFLLYFSRRERK